MAPAAVGARGDCPLRSGPGAVAATLTVSARSIALFRAYLSLQCWIAPADANLALACFLWTIPWFPSRRLAATRLEELAQVWASSVSVTARDMTPRQG